MNIKVLNEKGEELKQEDPVEQVTPPNVSEDGVYVKEKIAELFNMNSDEARKEASKLETLIEYARLKSDDHSPIGIYWAIKQLGLRLGTPPLGEKMINHAYMYARLYLETKENQEKMDALAGRDINGNN